MTEQLQVLALAIGWFAMLFALGIGPAWAFARHGWSRVALAPVVGLAVGSAVMTTAARVMPMRIAAFAVLVPLIVLSLAWFAVELRRSRGRRTSSGGDLVPAGLGALALTIGILPNLLEKTFGPMSWALRDAWWYVQSAYWLRGGRAGQLPASGGYVTDLIGSSAALILDHGGRLGVIALYAGGTSLSGLPADQTFSAFLAATFAVAPGAVWIMARYLGLGHVASAVASAAMIALSFGLVVDSALSNLAALCFIPVLIVAMARLVRERSWSAALLAGVMGAGILSTYSELVPFIVAAILGAGLLLLAWRRPSFLSIRTSAPPILARIGAAVVVMVVLAPRSVWSLVGYLDSVGSSGPSSEVVNRGFSMSTIWSWLFGIRHIYELELHLPIPLGGFGAFMAVALPVALGVCVVAGALARDRVLRSAIVLVNIAAALLLAYVTYRTGAGSGTCQYCLGKSLVYAFPFLAVGIGMAVDTFPGWLRGPARVQVVAVAGLGIVLLGLAGMAFQVRRSVHDFTAQAEFIPDQARKILAKGGPLPGRVTVWSEGIEDTGDAVSFLPGLYLALKRDETRRPAYDVEWNQPLSLYLEGLVRAYGKAAPYEAYADPDYGWVFTAWSGLDSGRERVATEGRYAIERRREPVDVVVARTNQIIGRADGRARLLARPSYRRPFELWVASREAGAGRVVMELNRPAPERPEITIGGRPANVTWGDGGRRVCVETPLTARFSRVHVQPPAEYASGTVISAVRGAYGGCDAVTGGWTEPAFFVAGAYPRGPVPLGGRDGRWLHATSVLRIGNPGHPRKPMIVEMDLIGFRRARTVQAAIGGRVVGSAIATVDPTRPGRLSVAVAAGVGAVDVTLRATPGDHPAARVDTRDPRRLAVFVTDPVVRSVNE